MSETRLEKATERRGRQARRIQLPGKAPTFGDADPVAIARELRARSKLGLREAKLIIAEADGDE